LPTRAGSSVGNSRERDNEQGTLCVCNSTPPRRQWSTSLPRPKSTTKNDLIAAPNRAESDSVAPGARQGVPAVGGGVKSLRCDRPRDRSGRVCGVPSFGKISETLRTLVLRQRRDATMLQAQLLNGYSLMRDTWPMGARRGAAADRVHVEQHRRVCRVNGPMRTMTALQRQSSKR
jgi:hypothetical protein